VIQTENRITVFEQGSFAASCIPIRYAIVLVRFAEHVAWVELPIGMRRYYYRQ
jgi:hypothetical protein